ncbi:MAG: 2-dehydropantoate 2-reductase [Pseudomonadaceae bacterium]|nr:2-dehydropantoate 2-reductase [Pseudomonadaceae bacterium]
MDISVVGCGAMGSIYAALLASAGNNVCVVDPDVDHINAINTRGLRVSGASGDRTVKLQGYTTPPAIPSDLIVCAVKARFVKSAAASLQSLIAPHTRVLTIQNGLGSAEIVADHVGAERLIVGVAQGFGASLPEPGIARHNDMKAIRMGAYSTLDFAEVAAIAQLWAEAGFDAAPVKNIAAMQWEKLICNVAYSAPCAITGMSVGEVMDHPHMSIVSRAAAREAFDIAINSGIALRFDDPDREIREFAERMPDAKPSVLLDLEAGRISEVDFINGAIPRQAVKIGLAAPINTTLTALVQTLESKPR